MSPRRIPTKAELLRLQKLYRTDQRIADALGNGITEQLVAYWRRKKGIATYSFPKFSEKEIREVWDRFGDDFHAGMELGISKAAFYNWRRRYKITKKPAALRLEQLSLELFTADHDAPRRPGSARQTAAQKILADKAEKKAVAASEAVEVEPDLIIANVDPHRIIALFRKRRAEYVWNPARVVLSLGGSGASSDGTADDFRMARDFGRRQRLKGFFEAGEGDACQLMIERGMVLPGQFVVGPSDVAACSSIGALSYTISEEEMALVWESGRLAVTVPESIRISLNGRLPRGVYIRDVAHHIAAHLDGDAAGRIIELAGPAVGQLALSERFTLCHILSATGARGLFCPIDATVRRYVMPRARRPFTPVFADRDAVYACDFTFELNSLKPVASSAEKVIPLEELSGVLVQGVFIGGAANGRFDDLKIVADLLKGKKVSPDVRLVIQPVTQAVYLEAIKKGLLRVFLEAGAIVFNPGRYQDGGIAYFPATGEKFLTTEPHHVTLLSDRTVYQVSPATAAVSAVTGQISSPAGFIRG